MIDIKSKIEKYDCSDMFKTLTEFPKQIKEALEIGKNSIGFQSDKEILDLMILGMGGSAIGGELLRSYCSQTSGLDNIIIRINRNYDIPKTINSDTFVIASSYSGGTEETISGFKSSFERTERVISITTGGELKKLSEDHRIPVISIPKGMMPRCAIAYSFVPMLYQVIRSEGITEEAIDNTELALKEIMDLIEHKSKVYSDINDNNIAIRIAKQLFGKLTVVYSSDIMDAVNLRWRGQIQENAKAIAVGNILPEMNHNEINSFTHPNNIAKSTLFVLLMDRDEHKKIKQRFEAITDLLGQEKTMIILTGEGKNLLTRMFDLIYLGDWVSYYLAILNEEDPTPIPMISKLKELLSK